MRAPTPYHVFVRPHLRRGRKVEGHWRIRPGRQEDAREYLQGRRDRARARARIKAKVLDHRMS